MMSRIDQYLIIGLRFTCLGIFLYSSISLTAQSMVAAIALFVSIFFVEPTKTAVVIQTKVVDIAKWNPLRNKRDLTTEPEISPDTISVFHRLLEESLTYDATEVESLRNFCIIQQQSQCAFAKNARLWGSADYQSRLSLVCFQASVIVYCVMKLQLGIRFLNFKNMLHPDKADCLMCEFVVLFCVALIVGEEENIRRSIPTFLKFTCVCQDLCLDGFLFEFPGAIYGQNVQDLGEAVRQLLVALSDSDPSEHHSMADGDIESSRWVFAFNRISFFITSFAPCYPSSNSRFSFGAQNVYVLFQPELSFARHDLPLSTPDTRWSKPRTVRDRIRVAFRDAGRQYAVPDTVHYPMVWDMVKPLYDGDDLVRWWTTTRHDSEEKFEQSSCSNDLLGSK